MLNKYLFFLIILLFTFTSEGPCELTEEAKDYTSCRDKPADVTSYCCYLKKKNGEKRCVELLKEEVKDDKIKDTWDKIEKGTYSTWKNGNHSEMDGFVYGELDELRCTGAEFLCNKNIWMLFMLVVMVFF